MHGSSGRSERAAGTVAVFLLAGLAAAVISAQKAHAMYAAFWCYPAVLGCQLVLPPRHGRVCSLTLFAVTVAMTHGRIGEDLEVRFLLSLGFVVGIGDTTGA